VDRAHEAVLQDVCVPFRLQRQLRDAAHFRNDLRLVLRGLELVQLGSGHAGHFSADARRICGDRLRTNPAERRRDFLGESGVVS
jgi:hypothetical protein